MRLHPLAHPRATLSVRMRACLRPLQPGARVHCQADAACAEAERTMAALRQENEAGIAEVAAVVQLQAQQQVWLGA